MALDSQVPAVASYQAHRGRVDRLMMFQQRLPAARRSIVPTIAISREGASDERSSAKSPDEVM
jgi:hypothetical protein